jgi:hypothetical protein
MPARNISASAVKTASRRGASSAPAGTASATPASWLRARQALREGLLVGEQALRQRGQGQVGQRAQRQRHLRGLRQTRVAGGKEQREFLVVELTGKAPSWRRQRGGRREREVFVVVIVGPGHVARGAPQLVDGGVARHAQQPAGGVGRRPVARPGLQGAQRGGLHRVLGNAELRQTQGTRQQRQHARALAPQDGGERGGSVLRPQATFSMRRISIHRVPRRCGQPCASSSAMASFSALTTK